MKGKRYMVSIYVDPDYVRARAHDIGLSMNKLTSSHVGAISKDTWIKIRDGEPIMLSTVEKLANALKISKRGKDRFLVWKFIERDITLEEEIEEAVEGAPWDEQ